MTLEKAPDEISNLVDEFLARDYYNPLADFERKGARFDLLKYLDLYYSPELDRQLERMVMNSRRTYRRTLRYQPVLDPYLLVHHVMVNGAALCTAPGAKRYP